MTKNKKPLAGLGLLNELVVTTQQEEFTTEMRGELIRRLHRLRRLLEKDGKEEKIRGNL